ncbi:AAA family ATPase [Photobacterium sp. MCCC 1A19761]|uniref:AAA family ATPase n=1 Tax=Photobacterium sp. MCCC 1A19761 TaxID=3115000 RepID=UPI00307ED64D
MLNSTNTASKDCQQTHGNHCALDEILAKPKTLEQTGVPTRVLESLLIKHLSQATDLDIVTLIDKLGLPGNLIEQLLQKLKAEALTEVRTDGRFHTGMRYGLTQKGMIMAQHELQRDGYLGPVPITIDSYKKLVCEQSSKRETITPERMKQGLSDLILSEEVISQVGPALNSGRAIFIYGLPGTGKTYISRRLVRLFESNVYIPYAVCIGNQVIQVFDPIIHTPINTRLQRSLHLNEGHDNRLVLCRRPEVVVGGELTAEMLEVTVDPTFRINRAPLQMKANNGIFLIDDLGRQKVSVDAILNRWIIPLEEGIDYLSLPSGEHFDIPFEQVLVFSSNIHPAKLADDAFLRRIGYKISFGPITQDDYCYLWHSECEKHGLTTAPEGLDFVIGHLHQVNNIPLLPCYPRDLVAMCSNQISFFQHPPQINHQLIEVVWRCYFVDHDQAGGNHGEG